MKKIKLSITLLFCLAVFLFPKAASFSSTPADQIVTLTNQIRKEYNLPPLKLSYYLTKSAETKAQDIFTNQYFSHLSPQGKTPWDLLEQENYIYRAAGENLAADFNTPQEAISAWLSSASHRSNLLDPNYQEIGVAVATGYLQHKKTTIIVQHFGSPLLPLGE